MCERDRNYFGGGKGVVQRIKLQGRLGAESFLQGACEREIMLECIRLSSSKCCVLSSGRLRPVVGMCAYLRLTRGVLASFCSHRIFSAAV